MRTGRNLNKQPDLKAASLDHWDMRTGRNAAAQRQTCAASLDHWDMRTGRNRPWRRLRGRWESRSLGYAHWPELDMNALWSFFVV